MENQDNNEKLGPDFTKDDLISNHEKPNISTDDELKLNDPYNDLSDKEQEPKKKINVKAFLFDFLFYAFLVFVMLYILPNFVIQKTIVDGSSMENNLKNGEQLYVEKISYHFDQLDRYDIIVFYPYGRKNHDYYVKRIIGMPGETVQIIGSNIYINGKILTEHYGKEPIEDAGRAAKPIKLGDDEYFVMGDNRNISKDSRDPSVGNVEKHNIGGKVFFRIWPLNRFGTVE